MQKEYPYIFVKFCKLLREVKLDYNIGIFITGVENLYSKSELNLAENFVFLLRSCSIFFPSFLKIILTVEKNPLAKNKSKVANIMDLLATKSVIEVKDSETFAQEGKSFLDFALQYG